MPYLPHASRLSRRFYGLSLLEPSASDNTLNYLERQAKVLAEGLRKVKAYPLISMSNHHPDFLGYPTAKLKDLLAPEYQSGSRNSQEDARVCLAREYGYGNWEEVNQSNRPFSDAFEKALKAFLDGELQALETILSSETSLTQTTSPFAHRATLLHYAASNGVEIWRQKVPENLAKGVRLLLDYGANPESKMEVYGGQFDVIALLDSSAHPKDAGCYESVRAVLRT